jgi:hypothetical protein
MNDQMDQGLNGGLSIYSKVTTPASLPPQDSRHTPLSFGLRDVGQAEIPDDRAVVLRSPSAREWS